MCVVIPTQYDNTGDNVGKKQQPDNNMLMLEW